MANSKKAVDDIQVVTSKEIGLGVVKIKVFSHYDQNRLITEVNNVFDQTFKVGYFRVVFDIGNVVFPNSSFIAMLIGRTMEARRYGGDVKIVNFSETTRNHLAMFSPLTYLSTGTDEAKALDEFAESDSSYVGEFIDLEEGKPNTLEVDASVDSLNMVTDFVASLAQKAGIDPVEISKLKIAVYEAGMNVIEHGYRFEPDKSMRVEVIREGKQLLIILKDKGKTFDFYNVKPYDVDTAVKGKRKGGYGLYIIQRSVDEIRYENDSFAGNRLTLIKRLT